MQPDSMARAAKNASAKRLPEGVAGDGVGEGHGGVERGGRSEDSRVSDYPQKAAVHGCGG
ncbi:MAG: hypothetical protein ACOC2R_04430 [Spirochaetota bacterium]